MEMSVGSQSTYAMPVPPNTSSTVSFARDASTLLCYMCLAIEYMCSKPPGGPAPLPKKTRQKKRETKSCNHRYHKLEKLCKPLPKTSSFRVSHKIVIPASAPKTEVKRIKTTLAKEEPKRVKKGNVEEEKKLRRIQKQITSCRPQRHPQHTRRRQPQCPSRSSCVPWPRPGQSERASRSVPCHSRQCGMRKR